MGKPGNGGGAATRFGDLKLKGVLPLGYGGCGISWGNDVCLQSVDNGVVVGSILGFNLWFSSLAGKRFQQRSLGWSWVKEVCVGAIRWVPSDELADHGQIAQGR